jgi:hypothetical protein
LCSLRGVRMRLVLPSLRDSLILQRQTFDQREPRFYNRSSGLLAEGISYYEAHPLSELHLLERGLALQFGAGRLRCEM